MANTYLTMTQPSGGSRRKWTWSAWVKKSSTGANQSLCVAYQDSANWTSINFETSDQLNFYEYQGNSVVGQKKLSMVSRDTNGWYHFMIIWDSENTTADDRMIIYVNGVRQTAFSASTNPAVNTSTAMNRNGYPVRIGTNNSNNYFNGIISDVNFCGGEVLAPTIFGETDIDTGEWRIKDNPTFTPGIGGYSILRNGNTITDQSANSNNFTVGGGTLTKTEDCPSNVFATFNPLYQTLVGTNVYWYGNTDLDSSTNDNEFHGASTLGMTSGKYYAEFKMKSGIYNLVGITSSPSNDARTNTAVRNSANSYGLYSSNGKLNTSTYAASYTTPNVIGCAVDLDNNKIYFSKDGVWATGSGAWGSSTFDSSIGAFSITDPSLTVEGAYFFAISDADQGSSGKFSANFGNGYQGTTAVSSAGTNASNNGIFEFDVPAGYTALSTKGLNL